MIYEYGYKANGQFTRNIYLPIGQVIERAGNKTDQYVSIFGYESEDVKNSALLAPFYVDIDCEDNLQGAYTDMQSAVDILTFYNLTNDDISLFFSGHKGFHILIDPLVFSLTPTKHLDKIYKKIAAWFELPSIDMKVYESRRLFRLPNTKNGKSNLHKIPITRDMTLDEILVKAQMPQPIQEKHPRTNKVLAGWIDAALLELTTFTKKKSLAPATPDKRINEQNQQLINAGVAKSERNSTVFYLSCYLRAKGFTQDEARSHIEIFCNNCTPAYTEWHEIDNTIHSAYKSIVGLPKSEDLLAIRQGREKLPIYSTQNITLETEIEPILGSPMPTEDELQPAIPGSNIPLAGYAELSSTQKYYLSMANKFPDHNDYLSWKLDKKERDIWRS